VRRLDWPDACHDDQVNHAAGMSLAQMLAVLDAVRTVGCRFWVEGDLALLDQLG
jgi:hypothetical protein